MAPKAKQPSLVSTDGIAAKLQRFTAKPKKSQRERDNEAELAKKMEADNDLKAAEIEFLKDFGGEEETGPTIDDRGRGVSVRSAGKGFVRAGGSVYNPLPEVTTFVSVPAPPAKLVPTGPRAKAAYIEPVISVKAQGKKRKGMDEFLDQLKRDQADREERLREHVGFSGSSVTALAAREYAPVLTGSYDSGDPLTTNVHVSPLPANITEQSLGMFFARFGPVGSVKIMWPRLDGPSPAGSSTRRTLGGFVAFLRRPDAEKAAKELDGFDWDGNILRTGWGKAVPLGGRAIYEIEGAGQIHRKAFGSSPSSPNQSTSSNHKRRRSSRSRSRSPPREIKKRVWPELDGGEEEEMFIEKVAQKIEEHGADFELVMREKEKNNPKFHFFREESLTAYHYFKMLMDRTYQAPSPRLEFTDEGDAEIYSSDSEEDSENESVKKGKLGKLSTKRFESLLRSLISTRGKIARGMEFAMEHAEASEIITDILIASLCIASTPVPRKLARLHLISDILHNSSITKSNAWTYRSLFERKLISVFDHLGDIYSSFPGRLKAEQFRFQIVKIVDVWESWNLFDPGVTEDLKKRLKPVEELNLAPVQTLQVLEAMLAEGEKSQSQLGVEKAKPAQPIQQVSRKLTSRFKSAGFHPAQLNAILSDQELEDDDLDGEAVDIDVDGVEMVEIPAPVQVELPAIIGLDESEDEDIF